MDTNTAYPAPSSSLMITSSPAPSSSGPRMDSSSYEPVIISLTAEEFAGSRQTGKELLEEYQVKPGQTIRYPYGRYIFDSHGDVPITSIKEARSKYPDWPIPDALGSYVFQDLTLYRDRTSVVFPDTSAKG